MTVSTSVGRRYTVGEILRRTAQVGGVLSAQQNLNAADRELGRFMLEAVLDEIASEGGPIARAIVFEEISLTAADVSAQTYRFNLPSTVLDVVGDGMWIPSDQADTDRAQGETAVKLIGHELWHLQSNKAALSSRPTLMYLHRELDIAALWLWPIPTDAGTLRVPAQRFLADVDDDTATLDLQPYWTNYILRSMSELWGSAKSLPVGDRALRGSQALAAMRRAKSKAKSMADTQIHVRRR